MRLCVYQPELAPYSCHVPPSISDEICEAGRIHPLTRVIPRPVRNPTISADSSFGHVKRFVKTQQRDSSTHRAIRATAFPPQRALKVYPRRTSATQRSISPKPRATLVAIRRHPDTARGDTGFAPRANKVSHGSRPFRPENLRRQSAMRNGVAHNPSQMIGIRARLLQPFFRRYSCVALLNAVLLVLNILAIWPESLLMIILLARYRRSLVPVPSQLHLPNWKSQTHHGKGTSSVVRSNARVVGFSS